MAKKNILIIRNAKSYDFGGGERFPVFLATALQQFGLKPIIISRSPKLLDFAQANNVKKIRGWWWSWQNWSGKFVLLFPFYFIWQCILTIWYLNIFFHTKPEVIHIQSKDDFIAATWAGRLYHKKIIWTDHADLKYIWQNLTVWYKNPVGKLVYSAAKKVSAITVVSQSELKLINDNLPLDSLVRHKLQVVYNGSIDVNSKYLDKNKKSNFTFCVASRLVIDKGIKEVISAFKRLLDDYSNIELLLLGDGPDEKILKTYAKSNKHIIFAGFKSDPLSYIKQSDVFIQPTYHEGFSVALVEASMLARPIIATAVGGNVEIIFNRKTGLLVPSKDINSLYEAMKLLYNDKNLRQTLAKNARLQYEKKFQFDKIVKNEFISLYNGEKL